MFRNSTELLDYALRELQVAIEENKKEVEITLSSAFSRDINEIAKVNQKFQISAVAEVLRNAYKDYYVKSIVGPEINSEITIKLPNVPAITYYPIVWKLSLQKK